MKEKNLLKKVAFTVEIHTQLRNSVINSKSKKAIRNHPLIHGNLMIRVMNVTFVNQICASDVGQRTISSQIVRNRTLQIRKFTRTQKSLKPVHTDGLK